MEKDTLGLIAWILIIVGALNWGLVGAFNFDLVAAILGESIAADVVYILVGVAALVAIIKKSKK